MVKGEFSYLEERIFQYIIRLVGPDLAKEDTTMRKALSVKKRIPEALVVIPTARQLCNLTWVEPLL